MLRQKKGQAAMEFLMTYGWAILAAIIAIGALAYFGVFNSGDSLPDICTINAPLGCDEHQVNTTDVRLIIRNGAGDTINITSITVGDCTPLTTAGEIADGSTSDINLNAACAIGSAGSKYTGDISITYLRSGAAIEQTSSGRITAAIV